MMNTEEKEGKIIRRERRSGKFVRSFNLGDHVEQSDIQASFKDGLKGNYKLIKLK